jgi:DNA-directed RNA polymerase subunit RPC12/RpoP
MPRTFGHEPERIEIDEGVIICARCGAENSISALYSERNYGHAHVINREGELDDYDGDDSDDFLVHSYTCCDCGAEEDHLENLILGEGEVFHGEEPE